MIKETPHDYRIKIEKQDLDLINKFNPKNALEVFCGNGKNSRFFSKLGMKVTAMESNIEFLNEAIKKDTNKDVEWLNHLIYYDAFPFEDETFDFIFSYQYINHNYKDEILNVLKEIFRVLKKGGIFSLKISDIEQFNLIHIRDNIYKDGDVEHKQIRYRKIAPQTFAKIEMDEVWIPHYAFYESELLECMEKIGFKLINIRKIRWNLVGNFTK
jgi:ubiquinone/menaquinone biosynthesis C-methylase UbiE